MSPPLTGGRFSSSPSSPRESSAPPARTPSDDQRTTRARNYSLARGRTPPYQHSLFLGRDERGLQSSTNDALALTFVSAPSSHARNLDPHWLGLIRRGHRGRDKNGVDSTKSRIPP